MYISFCFHCFLLVVVTLIRIKILISESSESTNETVVTSETIELSKDQFDGEKMKLVKIGKKTFS